MTMDLSIYAQIAVSFFLIAGGLLTFLGSLGILKFPDFYMRLHGPAKNTTLGLGGILTASLIYFTARGGTSIHEVLITLFLFLTAPISAHLMAKAALHLDVEFRDDHAGESTDRSYVPSERQFESQSTESAGNGPG
jgi:multicomponent K+:H+ antiporter subunit G